MEKKNAKNAMIEAFKNRNAVLTTENQSLRETHAAVIVQRDDALRLAKERGEALEAAHARIKELEQRRAEVRKISKPAVVATRVHVKPVPKPETADVREDRRPFGLRVQSAVAEFLKAWGRAPRDPQRIAWDRAYHINGALLDGAAKYSLEEIMASVGWIEYTLGEQQHSVEETREYLVRELPGLGRRGECELAFLDLAFPPEQQRANVREVEAIRA